MNFIKKEDIEWKQVKYLRQGESFGYDYTLWLNEPLASWDVYDYWERERIKSMRDNLKKGDVLFDIGTESGWCNLVYADMVGPENMVLIEPAQEFWPNIKALWEKNYPNTKPMGFWSGLFGTEDNGEWLPRLTEWPKASEGDLIDRNKYQYLHDHSVDIEDISLDQFVKLSGIVPNAITMDTEGSCVLIVRGAFKTLRDYHPQVWISVHPELMTRDYNTTPEELFAIMEGHGYQKEFLAEDHEQHFRFYV